jgi:hypothetical protein
MPNVRSRHCVIDIADGIDGDDNSRGCPERALRWSARESGRIARYGAGVVSIAKSAGIKRGSPAVSSSVPRTTAGSIPAQRTAWTTSSS